MRVEKSLRGVAVIAVPASRWPVVCCGDRLAVVRRHLGQWTADMAKPVRADLPLACLVMVVETLLDFNKVLYSGRARHHGSAA
jgi:hypothetical protein